jgi:hypothetical protein
MRSQGYYVPRATEALSQLNENYLKQVLDFGAKEALSKRLIPGEKILNWVETYQQWVKREMSAQTTPSPPHE